MEEKNVINLYDRKTYFITQKGRANYVVLCSFTYPRCHREFLYGDKGCAKRLKSAFKLKCPRSHGKERMGRTIQKSLATITKQALE